MQTARVQSLSSIEKNQNRRVDVADKSGNSHRTRPRSRGVSQSGDGSGVAVSDRSQADGRGRLGLFNSGRRGGRTLELACKMGRAGQAEESKRCGLNCKSGSLLG